MNFRLLDLLALCLLPLSAIAATAPAAKPFEKIEGCTMKADRWNDGDSFHVLTGSEKREIIVRLYFADTPEAESQYGERIDEQAVYFGISKEQAIEIAHEARDYTAKALSRPFTVWTRWRSALGRSEMGRFYSFVLTDKGEDLNSALVFYGLARIYGMKTPLPNGRNSRDYLAQLDRMEKLAKAAKRGAWRFSTAAAPLGQPKGATSAAFAPVAGRYVASNKSAVFHKFDCKSVGTISTKNLVKFGSREEAITAGKKSCAICAP